MKRKFQRKVVPSEHSIWILEQIDAPLLYERDVSTPRLQKISSALRNRVAKLTHILEQCLCVKALVPLIL
jgi:hypothetical protein